MNVGYRRGSARSIPAGGNAGWGQAEGRAPHLGSLLLKFLNGPFVDAPAFVDEVPGGGGFPRVHMPDDDDVDVRLLLPHAAGLRGAGRGGRRWGGRWERSCLLGEAAGEESGASKKSPPLCASPLSQPFGKGCVLPSPHLPAGPCARGCPASSGSSVCSGSEPACPRRGGQPGYFGLPRPASKSRQGAVFFGILPSTALAETPGSQGYVIDASKVPFPPWKNLLAAFSLFPNPRASPPCRGVPWEEPRVPVLLPGCPHPSPAGHSSGDNRASAKWGGQK